MPFIITVKQQERVPITNGVETQEQEIYRQTLEDFNLSKFVIALNKEPRPSRRKGAQVRTVGGLISEHE